MTKRGAPYSTCPPFGDLEERHHLSKGDRGKNSDTVVLEIFMFQPILIIVIFNIALANQNHKIVSKGVVRYLFLCHFTN